MKLTQVLCRWKKALPGGHLWRGKHKLYKKVTPLMIAMKKHEYEIEEKNMFYLRHPYLSVEEAANQSIPLTIEEQQMKEEKLLASWKNHKLLGDRFGFLKVSDKWE